jgi:hypothetical protein
MAVKLCAGLAGSYALKILLGRGKVLNAPYGLHFDAYKNKLKKTYLPYGNNGWIQKIKISIARKTLIKTLKVSE